MTKGLLGEEHGYVPQPAMYEYKPPSVFARNKWITITFLALLVALVAYWFHALHGPKRPKPVVSPEPVYIESLAPKG